MSLLIQERGLKYGWRHTRLRSYVSLLIQERGLKSTNEDTKLKFNKSLLIQERGLKFLLMAHNRLKRCVAPYTGAWIEMQRWNTL